MAGGGQAAQPEAGRGAPAGRDALPAIERPVGGGAIRGIDEKVSVAPSTGAATLEVPIPLTGGRSDVDPQLALVYAAGSGEGAFGLGWSLEVPRVRRRLDTGVPRYLDPIDATTPDSDVFTAEGEDLVPVLDGGRSRRRPRTLHGTDYVVCSYGPRTEGSAGTSTRPRFTARTWPSTPDCSPPMRCRRRDASSGAGSARPSSRWRPTW